jgi:hypothetical protein
MIERAPVREPVRVCPKCDDRTRKPPLPPVRGEVRLQLRSNPVRWTLKKASAAEIDQMKGKQG